MTYSLPEDVQKRVNSLCHPMQPLSGKFLEAAFIDLLSAAKAEGYQEGVEEMREAVIRGVETVQGHSVTKDADKCIQMFRNLTKNASDQLLNPEK